MIATVVFPKHLARHLQKTQVQIEASDLKCALDTLARDYRLDGVLLTSEGGLQPFIRVAIDEDVVTTRKPEDLERIGVAGKTVRIMTAFAGG